MQPLAGSQSSSVQTFASLQSTGPCVQPLRESHESVVQALLSSQFAAV
jgi:hypothetical protein